MGAKKKRINMERVVGEQKREKSGRGGGGGA